MSEDAYGAALALLGRKLLEDEATIGAAFPYVTEPSGQWRTLPASWSAGYQGEAWSHGNWFSGFWIGLLLAAHLQTGDERLAELARERMPLVAQRASDGNTHDIGFLFYCSAVPIHRITGDERYSATALQAADGLRRRLVTTRRGAYISSWGKLSDRRGRVSSAIDTMANLPLLYWAAETSGDASFRLAGEAHALMTRDAFIRPDHSTFHAVEYALPSGDRARGYTLQGWADDSLWSRGQAWAVYGYVATARATGKPEYVTLAEALARRYFDRLGDRAVPPWDFDAPAGPDCPEDSSTAAIMSSALLDLAELHPDPAAGAAWRARALATLTALCRDYLAREESHRGLLKHGCYSKPHNDGVDSAVIFGDFYFAEALSAALRPGRFRPVPQRLSAG